MRKYLVCFIFIISLFPIVLKGQGDPLLRIELEAESDAASYKVVPVGEMGVLLFYQTNITEDDYKFWIFVLYDKLMHERWRKEVPVSKDMLYSRSEFNHESVYLLVYDAESKKNEQYNYQIVKINIKDGNYEIFSGKVPGYASFVDFNIAGDNIFAGMNSNKNHSGIYSLNVISKETTTVSEPVDVKSRFETLYLDTLTESVAGIFNIYESKNNFYLAVEKFDYTGKKLNSIKVLPDAGKKFNSCKITAIGDDEMMIVGTYDVFKGNAISEKQYFDKGSTGFFSVSIKNNVPGQVNYYNFVKLDNNTGYLKSREFLEAKDKAARAGDNEEKYSLDFDLLLHNIIVKDSLVYFVAEAYYEEYHTVTSTYYDYYGRMIPTSYSVFDGYRYFNAYVLCFDNNAEKLWDNGMEIMNLLSYELFPRVVVYFNNDEMVLSYNYDGKIAAKTIKGNEVIDGVDYFPIETSYIKDKIVSDTKSQMEYWYDNYFIAYGFEVIKNNAFVQNSKRMVFYINKVVYK
jgi:hypothetical protein